MKGLIRVLQKNGQVNPGVLRSVSRSEQGKRKSTAGIMREVGSQRREWASRHRPRGPQTRSQGLFTIFFRPQGTVKDLEEVTWSDNVFGEGILQTREDTFLVQTRSCCGLRRTGQKWRDWETLCVVGAEEKLKASEIFFFFPILKNWTWSEHPATSDLVSVILTLNLRNYYYSMLTYSLVKKLVVKTDWKRGHLHNFICYRKCERTRDFTACRYVTM